MTKKKLILILALGISIAPAVLADSTTVTAPKEGQELNSEIKAPICDLQRLDKPSSVTSQGSRKGQSESQQVE